MVKINGILLFYIETNMKRDKTSYHSLDNLLILFTSFYKLVVFLLTLFKTERMKRPPTRFCIKAFLAEEVSLKNRYFIFNQCYMFLEFFTFKPAPVQAY